MGSKALGPHPAYFDSSRMVSSSPLSDSGYMRLPSSCLMQDQVSILVLAVAVKIGFDLLLTPAELYSVTRVAS